MDQIIADCRGSFVLKFIITPASGILSEKPEKLRRGNAVRKVTKLIILPLPVLDDR